MDAIEQIKAALAEYDAFRTNKKRLDEELNIGAFAIGTLRKIRAALKAVAEREPALIVKRTNGESMLEFKQGFNDLPNGSHPLYTHPIASEDSDRLESEIQRLQTALAFWLPSVPANDSEAAERCGDDAMLLVGLAGPIKPSAEELGWITFHVASDGWIPWRGGERPVPPETICEFENERGVRITDRADVFDWGWNSGNARIVAYRVIE